MDPTAAQADSPVGHGLESQPEGVQRGFRPRQEEREDEEVLEVTLGCGGGREPGQTRVPTFAGQSTREERRLREKAGEGSPAGPKSARP